jgi:hypothetical protein
MVVYTIQMIHKFPLIPYKRLTPTRRLAYNVQFFIYQILLNNENLSFFNTKNVM